MVRVQTKYTLYKIHRTNAYNFMCLIENLETAFNAIPIKFI